MKAALAMSRLLPRPGGLFHSIAVGVIAIGASCLLVERTPFADWAISPLVSPDVAEKTDAIVVAGAGVVGDCEPNNNGVRRVLLAVRLFKSGTAPRLFFTGGTGRPCAVSVAMAKLAAELGVPPSAIWLEMGSRSTRENAELSAPMLQALGVQRVRVVTDRLHGPRATAVFREMGFEAGQSTVPIYAGHESNLAMLYAGVREYAALAYYRARGWVSQASIMSGGGRTVHRDSVVAQMPSSASPRASGVVALLGASYAAGWALGPIGGLSVVNLGTAGQQSFEMLSRFERDVVPLRPDAVILWGFVNDVFRGRPGDTVVAARVKASYQGMVALARQHGITPVIATEVTIRRPRSLRDAVVGRIATLLGKVSYQDRVNRDILALNRWLVDLAVREDLLLLDLQSTLAESGGVRRAEFAVDDGSHISPAGYAALTAYARYFLEDHLVVR